MEARMEKQAEYVVVIPGVTGPTYTRAVQQAIDASVHWSYLPEVHGAVTIAGKLYEDFEFRYNSEVAPQLLPTGYYWYFRPNHNPIAQANFFIDLIMSTHYKLPPWVDVEVDGGLSLDGVANQLWIFIDRMIYYLEPPVIYTRGWWWNDNVASRSLWGSLDLAIARYVNLPEPWGNPGDQEKLRPYDWEDWLFWQWSADRPPNGRGAEFGAQSNSIDLDYYNGSQDDFDDEFGDGNGGMLLEERVAKLEVDLELLKERVEKLEVNNELIKCGIAGRAG